MLIVDENDQVISSLHRIKDHNHPHYNIYNELEQLNNSFALEYIRYLFENSDQADVEIYTSINNLLLKYIYVRDNAHLAAGPI